MCIRDSSRNVRNEIHDFKIHTGHQLAKSAFEAKFDVVDENFRRANFTFLPNRKDLVVSESSGTFDWQYVWSIDVEEPLRGGEFLELIQPVTEELSSSRYIRWTVNTDPSPMSFLGKSNLKGGTIEFRVKYNIALQVDH